MTANMAFLGADEVQWVQRNTMKFTYCRNIPGNGNAVRVRFLTDPLALTPQTLDSWYFFREVDTYRGGLIGGEKMPKHLTRFPVFDVKQNEDGTLERARDLYLARVAASSENDISAGRTYASATTRVLTSVMYESGRFDNYEYQPQPGQVMLLKLAKTWYETLKDRWTKMKLANGLDWSPVGLTKAWDLQLSGSGLQMRLNIAEVESTPMEIPEPIDAGAYVAGIRREAEEYIDGLDGVVTKHSYDIDEDIRLDDSTDWDNTGNEAIKAALTKHGVMFSPKASRPELVKLAKTRLTTPF